MGLKLLSLCIGYITTGFVKFSPSLSNYQLSLIGSGPGFELLTSEVEGEAVTHNTIDLLQVFVFVFISNQNS